MLQAIRIFAVTSALVMYAAQVTGATSSAGGNRMTSTETIALPPPRTSGTMTLEETLQKRHSVREFRKSSISLADVSQLLWAAQGITHSDGFRTAPSAGALYPLEVYLLAGDVHDLQAGIYHYIPSRHKLEAVRSGRFRAKISDAALQQSWLEDSAAILIVTAVESRTAGKYGPRGTLYIRMEAGHAAQNVLLQATALGLGGTPVGAFNNERIAKMLGLTRKQDVLYLLPIGKPR